MGYENIPGWTCKNIEELYRETAGKLTHGGTVVEVGVAYGRSLAYLAERAHHSLRIFGVDTWHEHMGGDNLPPDVFARQRSYGDALEACKANLNEAGCLWRVELIREGSAQAAAKFEDASCDLVFLDACHEYGAVRQDIAAWLPKVRKCGMLAGHDYSWTMFPGVIQAVEEAFGNVNREIRGVVWRVTV